MMLRDWVWYNLKLSKSKFKIRYNFMGSIMIVSVFVQNVLNKKRTRTIGYTDRIIRILGTMPECILKCGVLVRV